MRILIVLLITLAGCGGGETAADPAEAKMTKLCGQTYSSTVDSLKDVFTQAGKDMPEMPTKETYAAKCVALGFTEDQVKCMDPKRAGADPEGCKATLEPVLDKKKELSDLLTAAMKKPEEKTDKTKTKTTTE